MIFDTDRRRPLVGQGCMCYSPRTCPGTMYLALVTRVSARRIEVLIPHLHGKGWAHADPSNRVAFTWRESARAWAQLGDAAGHDVVLFADTQTAAEIEGTFAALGGHPKLRQGEP